MLEREHTAWTFCRRDFQVNVAKAVPVRALDARNQCARFPSYLSSDNTCRPLLRGCVLLTHDLAPLPRVEGHSGIDPLPSSPSLPPVSCDYYHFYKRTGSI
jgi:hypothetical protein